MRPARSTVPADRFLGVRLTQEEVERLDQWREQSGTETRSEAVRALVRLSERTAAETPKLPPTVQAELEQLVEDGFARDVPAALDTVLTLGLQEFARVYAERLPALRRVARDNADRRTSRRRADREGRRLLDP
ncbi:MAG TPA: ribbon-helix-helix domain-containing protein [Thermoplasmata archaeon]|nr:ribbon-helix-helix domain-containing protein [Thermoplasmata archaeon]